MRSDSGELPTCEEESTPAEAQPDIKKARRHRRRHRRAANQGPVGMSDASTRSGSPSSSQCVSEVALSRRGSADVGESDNSKPLASNSIDAQPIGSPQRSAVEFHTDGFGLAGTSPARKPCPLSLAAMGDASQRQPMTPVSSPSKMRSFTATCGSRLLLPKAGLVDACDPFQSSPAGTPAATPMAKYNVISTSPPSPCKSAKPGDASQRTPLMSPTHTVAPTGDASQRTPLMSPAHAAAPSTALASWLCGSPCHQLPSGPELAELLKAALPEAYDD
jgi:hypothetical protein